MLRLMLMLTAMSMAMAMLMLVLVLALLLVARVAHDEHEAGVLHEHQHECERCGPADHHCRARLRRRAIRAGRQRGNAEIS